MDAVGRGIPEAGGDAGIFTVSLDFELYWGVRDVIPLEHYADRLRKVREAVPRMLALFREFGIHATWATVGFLFMESFEELRARRPAVLPGYRKREFCPYAYSEGAGNKDRVFHFAPDLVQRIRETPGQEIASHTLSHFYCLEEPRSLEAFRADLQGAIDVAKEKHGLQLKSLVFPRNQYSPDHARVAGELGIRAIRGNPASWMYAPRSWDEGGPVDRGARLLDAYLPVARGLLHEKRALNATWPVDVKASRFLRAHSHPLRHVEALKLGRIKREMSAAARTGRLYHLWWHPHNFGVHLDENLRNLRELLETFQDMKERHGMRSLSMAEVAEHVFSSRRVVAA